MLGLANLRAQTSSDMPLGGLVLKRSGMEEGEARRAVNSSAISAIVTLFYDHYREYASMGKHP